MHKVLHQFITICILGCAFLTGPGASAQVHIVNNDTTICTGQSVTLVAASGSGVPTNTALTTDDIHSSIISMGFPFTFYGTSYTQCVISSNGYITFNLSKANLGSEYNPNTGGPVPGNPNVLNAIMANWTDLDPSVAGSGSIDYAFAGSAPNRKFIVNFCDIPMYSTACNSLKASFQIILYETTNIIEVHLRSKVVCPTWPTVSPGSAVEGLQNADGTIAHLVPGRGYPTVPWTATKSSHRFTPTSSTNYTIDSIGFAPIATAGTGNINWYYGANIPAGTGTSITVTPTANITYYARQVYCSDTTLDSVKITLGGNPNIDSIQVHNPSYCGNNDGSLVLFGLQPNTNYRIEYNKNGITQPLVLLGSTPAGTLTIANLTSGTYDNIGVSTELCNPNNRRGPYVLVDPRIPVDFTTTLKFGCQGADSVQFVNTTPTPGTINYTWDFGDGNFSTLNSVTHAYFNQAVYTVKLSANNGTCHDSVSKTIDTRHPLEARFNVDYTNACQGQVLNFKDSSVVTSQNGIQPQYFWDFGDGGTATGSTAIHAFTTTGTFTVRLVVQDFVPCTDTVYKTITVNAPPSLIFTSNTATLCEGQGAIFTGDFMGTEPKSFDWTLSDGTFLQNLNPISHAFDSSGVYTIKLTTHYEFCPDTNYTQTVTVNPFPGINIGPDTSLCPNASAVTLRNFADFGNYPGATYVWNTGATTPSISVNQIGTYSATISYNGCTATDSMTISKDCYLEVPNSFSPNGDGLNDYFLPRQLLSRSVSTYKMSVYNRWGQTIFETTSLVGRGWDGRFNGAVQPQGVYIYIIDVSYTDGRTEHYSSNVTLLR